MTHHFPLLILIVFSVNSLFAQEEKDRPTSYEDDLTINWSKENDNAVCIVTNLLLAPIEMIVSDRQTEKELRTLVVPPKDSLVLFELSGDTADSLIESVREDYKVGYFVGYPDTAKIEWNYPYRLPFKKGKKYEVSQGWNGKTSHRSKISYHAYDFQLDIGEPVHAARDGLVIKAIDWFTKKGGTELRNSANRIVVLHDDGTTASYVHLTYKGVLVNVGDRVTKGQHIGISGLTGYTNGPHLHFVVRRDRDQSIPVYFEGYPGLELKKRKRYKVIQP